LISVSAFSTTYIVDINGGGQYTSINAAIGVASSNDTVKVWPGTYFEQVTLNKNITLMGSGYENTVITGNFNPTITMSSGRLEWFMISSTAGNGIMLSGGIVRNCVIKGCSGNGIYSNSGSSSVINCVCVNNASNGIQVGPPGHSNVTNCISRNNTGSGYRDDNYGNCITLTYSNGSRWSTGGNQGCIDQDPQFTSSTDYHISEGSPCWNTGQPSLTDPDGSVSDMGYFGGIDCPIYPVVTEIIITPGGNTINLQAKGRANY